MNTVIESFLSFYKFHALGSIAFLTLSLFIIALMPLGVYLTIKEAYSFIKEIKRG